MTHNHIVTNHHGKRAQIKVRGYVTIITDNDRKTETHYAVRIDGKILYSGGHPINCTHFGPANPDDWGHSSNLPSYAEFVDYFWIYY